MDAQSPGMRLPLRRAWSLPLWARSPKLWRASSRAAANEFVERNPVRRSIAALIFWGVSFAVLSVRALLLGAGVADLPSLKRALTTLVGAGAYRIALTVTSRCREDGRRWLPVAAACALAGSLVVLASRLAITWAQQGSESIAPVGDFRWVLVWSGYFLASILAWATVPEAVPARSQGAAPARPGRGDMLHQVRRREIWVERQGLRIRVDLDLIDYVEVEGNYVHVHFAGSNGILRGSLKAMATLLHESDFVQTHRSVLCRRSLIKAVRRRPTGAFTAILNDGSELPVGRSYAPEVMRRGRRLEDIDHA